MSIAGLIKEIIRSETEYANGRILIVPNLWVPSNSPEADSVIQKNGGVATVYKNTIWARIDGRLATLVKKQAVRCPNVGLWPDAIGDSVKWVPLAQCLKCAFYRKPGQYKYPTCAWAAENRAAAATKGRRP
jgi:hypothetical protein